MITAYAITQAPGQVQDLWITNPAFVRKQNLYLFGIYFNIPGPTTDWIYETFHLTSPGGTVADVLQDETAPLPLRYIAEQVKQYADVRQQIAVARAGVTAVIERVTTVEAVIKLFPEHEKVIRAAAGDPPARLAQPSTPRPDISVQIDTAKAALRSIAELSQEICQNER
jgi:hypothetical protein